MLKTFAASRYLIWLVLAVPAASMIAGLTIGSVNRKVLLHPTGEFAARFMIVSMMATPLRLRFPQSAISRWLIQFRREFGVAAAAYAALHTVLYVFDRGSAQRLLVELPEFGIWTGWLAMLILVPLALTSNNWSVRLMAASWKQLQRLGYLAAVFTLVHWIFIHADLGGASAHFLPLAALQAYRIWRYLNRKRGESSGRR